MVPHNNLCRLRAPPTSATKTPACKRFILKSLAHRNSQILQIPKIFYKKKDAEIFDVLFFKLFYSVDFVSAEDQLGHLFTW